MKKNNDHLKNLTEIRSLMERSSKFISLSGLSGIFAGIIALIGAGAAFYYLKHVIPRQNNITSCFLYPLRYDINIIRFLITDALIMLLAATGLAILFTTRKARNLGLLVWDNTSKRLLINLLIPLVAGGFFCLILLYHKLIYLVAPATLIFYGLALLNASKYTLNEIRYLGISEIILGLTASVMTGYGLLFWTTGFGLLHIVYGVFMYNRYERASSSL